MTVLRSSNLQSLFPCEAIIINYFDGNHKSPPKNQIRSRSPSKRKKKPKK